MSKRTFRNSLMWGSGVALLAAAGAIFLRDRTPQQAPDAPIYEGNDTLPEEEMDDCVDLASWESFPASDPPAWTYLGTGVESE